MLRNARQPTRFALPVIVTLALALLLGGKFFYTLFYLTMLSRVLPYVLMTFKLKRLTGSIDIENIQVATEDTVQVKIRITNNRNTALPFLEVHCYLGENIAVSDRLRVISLQAKDTVNLSLNVTCNRRGIYHINSLRACTTDIWGHHNFNLNLSGDKILTVYPKIERLDNLGISASQFFGSLPTSSQLFEDYSSVSDLREWTSGDELRRVHWKASAKIDEIMVKNFESAADAHLHIVVDMAKTSYQSDVHHILEDFCVNLCLSLVHAALEHGIPASVAINSSAEKHLAINNLDEFRFVMDAFVDLTPNGNQTIHSFILNNLTSLAPRTTVAIITPVLSEQVAASLLQSSSRLCPRLLLLTSSSLSSARDSIIQTMLNHGIATQIINTSKSVRDNLGGRTA